MEQQENKDFEGQGLLGLTKKEDEEILKAAEDIFGPADELKEEGGKKCSLVEEKEDYNDPVTIGYRITKKGKQHLAGIRENAPELAKEKEELKKAKFERGYIRAKRNSVFHKEQLSESTKETKEIRKSSTVKALTWEERRLWKYPLR
ncbi:hypothetical protein LCGC14_2965820 [marine sediment metagenome]|uniref:Uncharacterized protein n=1 Tax=marine sediment metagenome TaxID=412755 RepID=A0A0F8XAT1_9ZZZZ